MSVSTWESWFNKDKGPNGEFETQTEWHRVVAWGDQVGQRIAKLKKGDLVLVSGIIRTRSYTDANDIQRWTTEITGQVKPMPNATGNASRQPSVFHCQRKGPERQPRRQPLKKRLTICHFSIK